MTSLSELTEKVVRFRDQRDWKQFHRPKEMVLSLMLEAAELAEHFQWKDDAEIAAHLAQERDAVGDELADVLYWVLLASHDFEIDLSAAFQRKMEKNIEKYPAAEARGRHVKYNQLAGS